MIGAGNSNTTTRSSRKDVTHEPKIDRQGVTIDEIVIQYIAGLRAPITATAEGLFPSFSLRTRVSDVAVTACSVMLITDYRDCSDYGGETDFGC